MIAAFWAVVGKIAKKVLAALAGDKKGRKFLGYVIGIALFIVLLPVIAVYGLFGWMAGGGATEIIDYNAVCEYIPVEQRSVMEQYESELAAIQTVFVENGLGARDISKAKTIYISCLTGKETEEDFYPSVGYLSKQGVRNMRSALGNDIFRDELQFIYREQTDKRDQLKKEWKAMLDEILQKISENEYGNPDVEQKLILLSDKLSRTKGKKVYGYLKRDVKDLIDSIVDILAEDENISKLYDLWYEKKYEILRTYTSEMPPKIPQSQNKEFKSIKNEIIREAMRIHENSGQTTVEPQKTITPHQTGPTVSATAVTRLFKNLCNIFRDKIDDRKQKSLPTIDKRQKKEIEEKKNAEISMQ